MISDVNAKMRCLRNLKFKNAKPEISTALQNDKLNFLVPILASLDWFLDANPGREMRVQGHLKQ